MRIPKPTLHNLILLAKRKKSQFGIYLEQCAVDVKFVHPSFCCREANESLNWLHDRMPAILPDEEAVSAWLNQDLHGFEALKVLQSLPGFEKKSAVS